MDQCLGANSLLQESGTTIVLTCYMNPLLIVLPLQFLGYCSISGYSVDGLKRCEASGLLDCITDGYYDIIPATIVTLLRLWNCIDFIF